MKIKVIGLQRSGTNWLEHLIRKNLEVFTVLGHVDHPFWKHHLPTDQFRFIKDGDKVIRNQMESTPIERFRGSPDVHLVLVRKQLNSWIKSLGRNCADLKETRPYLYDPDGNLYKGTAEEFHHLYHTMWAALTRTYLSRIVMVDYERVLEDFESFLCYISARWNIEPKRQPFEDVERVPFSDPLSDERKLEYIASWKNRNSVDEGGDQKYWV